MSDLAAVVRDCAGYLESWVDYRRRWAQVPGVQVAIRVEGELVASFACGVSNVETGEPLTTEHLFHVASHSKTFTATAIMQLVEAGRLRLDDTCATWVPELAGSPVADCTVRELVSHNAGVNRDGADSDYWQQLHDFPDREALLAMARQDAVFAANEHFKYSNVGFGILGLVLEAASGMPYEELVTTQIVDRLGLQRTGPEMTPDLEPQAAAPHSAKLFGDDPLRVLAPAYSRALASATGFYSTAEDLTAYLSCHAFGRDELVSDASKRQMQQVLSTVTKPSTRHYGLGLMLRDLGDQRVVGHSGGWPGHITQSWLDPVSGLCVSVLTNCLESPASEWCSTIVRLIALAMTDRTTEPDAEGIDRSRFTGRYAAAWGVEDIAELGGRLFVLSPAAGGADDLTELRVVDATTLAAKPEAGYDSVGEPYLFTFDGDRVVSVRQGGMQAWPIDDYLTMRDAAPTAVPDDAAAATPPTDEGTLAQG